MWSPPRVITRGSVLPCSAGPVSLALVAGARDRIELCPSSICCNAYALSYLLGIKTSDSQLLFVLLTM